MTLTENVGTRSGAGQADRAIAVWLFICCAMVFVMVVLGGVTRLTHSGLSMVEWRPLTGLLPPLGEAEWRETFEKYKQFPEYQKINLGMTLAEFKSIFWLEFIHRLWGRAIGVVFLVPLVFFAVTGRIGRRLLPGLIMVFVLGGLQGLLGWYMVKSGMVDRPDVSQYRLAAHLVAAFILYGYLFWLALGLMAPRGAEAGRRESRRIRRYALALLALVIVTVTSGGFVAGLDAGFVYNTFPLMDGRLIAEEITSQPLTWERLFGDVATVQFGHRVLAVTTGVGVLLVWWLGRRARLPVAAGRALDTMLALGALQVALGIATLLTVVALPVAAAHQAGALALLTAILWVVHEATPRAGRMAA